MRVGIVSPYNLSEPGGVQAQVLGLARELEKSGTEARVIGPGLPAGVAGIDLGGTVKIRANGSVAPISVDPRTILRMRQAFDSLDVVHIHEPLMPLVSWTALVGDSPRVGTFHADPRPMTREVYRRAHQLVERILRRITVVTAVSETAASILPPGTDARIVPNGVDVAALHKDVPRSEKRVAFLGRDEPRKGLHILLDAWEQVREAVPDAELVVMGRESGGEGIDWRGRVGDDEKAEVLSSSAVYVAPNLGGESFGIVVVEGMAAGAAVIASDLAAFRQVGGDSVVYVPPGNANRLAVAIAELLRNHTRRAELGAKGPDRAKAFDWAEVVTSYRRCYEDAILAAGR